MPERLSAAVAAAEEIPGWMSHEELTWLGEQAAERDIVVEVGSWQGRSTKVLAMMTEGTVYAIDDLSGETSDPLANQGLVFGLHLADEVEFGKVKVIERPSLDIVKNFEPGFADMVFIDGDHEYPAPLEDIKAWRPILEEGGLLCGHDCWLPGVDQSLAEAFPGGIRVPAGSIWVAR